MTKYMAIAMGRGSERERTHGCLVPYGDRDFCDTRDFEARAARYAIDILYKGPNKEDAKKAIAHLRSVRELVSRLLSV